MLSVCVPSDQSERLFSSFLFPKRPDVPIASVAAGVGVFSDGIALIRAVAFSASFIACIRARVARGEFVTASAAVFTFMS